MSLLTNWGYTLVNADTMPDMLTKAEYDVFTGGKYATDGRSEPNIAAACSAVRNYCNWHVYPSEACRFESTFFDACVSEVDGGVLIQLPAKYVSAVTGVTIGGTAHDKYVLETNGMLRLYGISLHGMHIYTQIVVEYTAGVPDALMAGLKELIAHRVTHAMASTSGVQSETAGGVSITYNATWANTSRATALADDNKEVLQPYRVQGVF